MASPDPDHGIILWTLIVAAVSTVIVLVTAFFAWRTVKWAKEAVDPLKKTVAAAERLQESGKLLRQIEACGKVLDALLSISLIEVEAAAEAIDDPYAMSRLEENKFLVAKSRILAAIPQLPAGLLPKAAEVTRLPGFSGSEEYVGAARQEVTGTLDRLQRELQALGRQPS
jgi:uncharacterized membrane protein YccC